MSQYQSKGGRRDAQHKKPGKFAGSAGNRKGASFVTGKGGVAEGTGPSNRTSRASNIVSAAAAPPTSSLPPVTSTIKTEKEANGAATLSRGATAVKISTDVNQTQAPSVSQKDQKQKQSEVKQSSSSADPAIAEPAFTFQFGSISPGFIQHTGIQILARTSSAPPTLDEQKRKQAVYEEDNSPLGETHDNHAVAHGTSSFDVQTDVQTQVPTQYTKVQFPTVSTMQPSKPEGSSLQLFNAHFDDNLPQTVQNKISSRHNLHMATLTSNENKLTNSNKSYEDLSSAINDSSVPVISLSQDKLPLAAKVEMKNTSIDGAWSASGSSALMPSKVVSRKLSKSQIGGNPGSDANNGSNCSHTEEGLPAAQLASVESLETAFQGSENSSITSEEKLLGESGRTGSSIHLDHFSKDSSADNNVSSLDHSILQKDAMSQEAHAKFHPEVIGDTDKLLDESGLSSTSTCFFLQENVNPVLVYSSGSRSVLQEDGPSIIDYSRTPTSDKNFAYSMSTDPNLGLASDLSADLNCDNEVEDVFALAQVSKLANDVSGTLHTLDTINTQTQIATLSDPMEDHLNLKVSLGVVTATNLGEPYEKLASDSVVQDLVSHGKLGHKQVEEHGSTSLNSSQVHSVSDVLSANNYLDSGNTAPIVSSIHNVESQCSSEQTGSSFVEQPPLISNPSNIVKEAKQGSKKKKKKELLAKADAAGSTADLYNAYKAPEARRRDEEKPMEECGPISEEIKLTINAFKLLENNSSKELDDWEDAAELPTSTPTFIIHKEATSKQRFNKKNHASNMNKYTRDFLSTFRDQSYELPPDFKLHPSLGDNILTSEASAFLTARETSFNLERSLEHQSSTVALHERRGSVGDEDRWAKLPGFSPTSDFRGDMSFAAPYSGFWPGPNANIGLTARNPLGFRPGMPVLPAMMLGDIPGAPFTHMVVGPIPRPGGVDADRWQRASTSQKGLIPSPQTPSPAIHKAEKRYEVGKASDEEEVKQRQIKAILNKLTPQNFDRLFEQVKEVKIETAATLTGVISQIFDKALMEPTFCEMYAKFCVQLALKLPEFNENGEKVTFRRVLLNKCQEEFERGVREQEEAEKEEEGQIPLTKEEREAKKLRARRRMLGNIRFIGELYKKAMLTERIMHECIKKLLGEYQNPEEEDIEALCKLMATIGLIIDHPKAKAHLDAYFDRMNDLSNNKKLSSRLRFMLKDAIDLRRNGWQERRKVEGPKKIDEVHRDAAQERQSVSVRDRMARLPSIGGYTRRSVSSNDSFIRGNSPFLTMPTGTAPPFAARGGTMHVPVYGQDFRMDDRSVMDSKTLPFPLMQKLNDEVTVTLVPQGGLGKGFGAHSQPPASTARSALADVPPIILGDSRRAGIGPIHPVTDRGVYGGRHHEEFPLRPLSSDRMHGSAERPLLEKTYMSDRYGSSYGWDMRGIERSFSDRSMGTLASRPGTPPSAVYSHSAPLLPQVLSEEQLIKRCKSTIREYYSIRNLKEAVHCVDELKAPQFHPKMVSIWISDSLEKKESDMDLLVTLLTHLRRMDQPLLTHEQLFQGFQEVLFLLEDTKVDVPKAPSYLAGIMGKLLAESVVSLKEVSKLLMEGGLERGSLLETGDALIMFVDVLDILRKEQGDTFMVHTYTESGLALEEFLGHRNRPEKLHALLESKNLQVLYPWPL